MGSALLHMEVVTDYLKKELSLGRMLGPFPSDFSTPELHINCFGVIPKGHDTGRWRLITDLSFPPERSVNDGVDAVLCSLVYTSVDRVAEVAAFLGPGALLAKVDIELAYRLIPVHPEDRPLQAMRWNDQIYIDPMLPFGLRSAPKNFNAVTDALHWYLGYRGIVHLFHYLDDFIVLAPPQSPDCQRDLSTLLEVCVELGVPITSHKTEGPATCLVFLGIEVDTVANELRLPGDKRPYWSNGEIGGAAPTGNSSRWWGCFEPCLQGGPRRAVILTSNDRPASLTPPLCPRPCGPSPVEQGVPSGPGMVAMLRPGLERGVLFAYTHLPSCLYGSLRCVRAVGLWGVVCRPVVPGALGYQYMGPPYCRQGAAPNPGCRGSVGSHLVGPSGAVLV